MELDTAAQSVAPGSASAPSCPGAGSPRRPLPVLLLAALLAAACTSRPPDPPGVRFTLVESPVLMADTSSSPSASWIDLDGDGDLDLYVLSGFGQLVEGQPPQPDRLYRNRGDGTFEAVVDHPLVRDTTYSGSATWGDYDNDGDRDVFVADQRGADNRLYRNVAGRGGGDFTRITEGPVVSDGGRSFSATWVDVDSDGWLDLHVLNGRSGSEGEADFLYRNLEGEGFERVEGPAFVEEPLASGGAAWADYDADGDPDLFLPVYTGGGSRLYRNDGDWSFTEITEEAGIVPDPLPSLPATSVAHWVDYDGDLDLDLFVGTTGGFADFLFENRDGRFRRVEAGRLGLDATYVSDATWLDADNDGDLDLAVATWGSASELYLNDGSGRLRRADGGELGDVIAFASSVSAGDVEGDGDLDLYLTQWPINEVGGAPNLLYRNDTEGGNWVEVALEGTTSNRSAVGARVVVTAEVNGEVRRQLRHVTARTSWRATGDLTRHFGLGDARRIDAIEVAWPSGQTDSIPGPLEVNRRIRIVEGQGLDPR